RPFVPTHLKADAPVGKSWGVRRDPARLTRQRLRQWQRGAISIGGGRCRMRLPRFGKHRETKITDQSKAMGWQDLTQSDEKALPPNGRLVASRARPSSVPDRGHLMARNITAIASRDLSATTRARSLAW